jgi:hypothetical protein
MQPYYEALTLGKQPLGSRHIPSVVTQIADGENGGVMMNEFPEAFVQAHRKALNQNSERDGGQAQTVAINGSEWLELLEQAGVTASDFPEVQAVQQHRLWKQVGSDSSRETVNAAIEELKASNSGFSMEGASWTNNLSWVEGYDNVLEPMNQLSAAFHQHFDQQTSEDPSVTTSERYQKALLHLLLLETSCFRYWGQGTWTEYARNIHSRGQALLR